MVATVAEAPRRPRRLRHGRAALGRDRRQVASKVCVVIGSIRALEGGSACRLADPCLAGSSSNIRRPVRSPRCGRAAPPLRRAVMQVEKGTSYTATAAGHGAPSRTGVLSTSVPNVARLAATPAPPLRRPPRAPGAEVCHLRADVGP